MRISDWSSDVCSSDLRLDPAGRGQVGAQASIAIGGIAIIVGRDEPAGAEVQREPPRHQAELAALAQRLLYVARDIGLDQLHRVDPIGGDRRAGVRAIAPAVDQFRDRTSAVSGTSVSVRVALGGRRLFKTTNNPHTY